MALPLTRHPSGSARSGAEWRRGADVPPFGGARPRGRGVRRGVLAGPDPLEELRTLAEQLLDGADERDLTEEFLIRPWPFPAVILADLTALRASTTGYVLRYPGHLALREAGAAYAWPPA